MAPAILGPRILPPTVRTSSNPGTRFARFPARGSQLVVGSRRRSRNGARSSSSSSSGASGAREEEGAGSRLAKRLGRTISERQLLRPRQRVLVAVSGGQDSVCLLHLMLELRDAWDWSVGVVNCDHRWSAPSRRASALVAQLAQSRGLDYYQAVATSSVLGEGAARTWRYGVFRRLAARHGYEAIVTAHTASDRVETLLYNLCRGTGISGLQSLTWKRWIDPVPSLSQRSAFRAEQLIESFEDPQAPGSAQPLLQPQPLALVRPLLDVTRSELRDFHRQMKMPLWPDPSNHFLDIDRNRIRHELLPYLRKHFNGGIDKSLARWAEILHGEQLYLDNLCRSILGQAESEVDGPGPGRRLDVVLLKSLPIALQRRVLKQFADNFTGHSLGFDAVERLRQAACSESSGARKALQLSIHGGFIMRLQNNILTIVPR
ncbi:tRNA(Ile)-lysidine synthase [Marchantia polymorpha subsp. ruderalis]